MCRIAKDAGMKYITITTKHHEGFALFDSQLTEWDVMATPFQRDIMKELAARVPKQGIVICWYHSILDWHHPTTCRAAPGSQRPWDTRRPTDASYDRYIDFMKGQLTELLTQLRADRHHLVRRRLGAHGRGAPCRRGDRADPQAPAADHHQRPHPGAAGLLDARAVHPGHRHPRRDWETCMTMNGTWGYHARTPGLEADAVAAAQPGRHREQGRQLPAERRPDRRRLRSRTERRAPGRHGPLDEGERREHLRHDREPLPRASAFGRCTTKAAQLPAPAGKSDPLPPPLRLAEGGARAAARLEEQDP
jgi:hypothetical protein